MDFLVLFLFYLAAVLVGGAMICVCSRTSYLRGLVRGGTQVFSYIIPECLQRAMLSLVHYLFHTRNYVFVVLHLTLQGMVYTEYTWEVFGYCRDLGFSLCYLLLPYLLLVVNLAFFTLSSVTDPGAITKANELLLLQVYEFDEVMFPKDARCPTCDLRKPARSKHCGKCGPAAPPHPPAADCEWASLRGPVDCQTRGGPAGGGPRGVSSRWREGGAVLCPCLVGARPCRAGQLFLGPWLSVLPKGRFRRTWCLQTPVGQSLFWGVGTVLDWCRPTKTQCGPHAWF
ncbi:zinc finger DHHC-type palmitoyltransferase 4 [Phyllostomus discolor]|uniref:Zinc finger DHHC-type palmitoyltransferase 4 n=1 Tax=Phyllostomus discolor TaxID=89673 RepID=A0A833YWM8_9CHIR|nr:zinc finger DHHC-type palmitoyltransferase 4 [Phyllostomus discolor]